MQIIQSVLAVIGVGMIAYILRWQIGFFTLDSIKPGKNVDRYFVTGCVLVSQYFFF